MTRDSRLEVGDALYARLGGGFIEVGPAILPGSASRFWRGSAPPVQGVPLVRAPEQINSAPRPAQGASR